MSIIKEIGRNPNIDWIAIIVTSLIIVAGLGVRGLTLYNAVTNGSIQGGERQGSAHVKINEKAISSVIERFEEKAKVTAKVKAGYTGVPDPAL